MKDMHKGGREKGGNQEFDPKSLSELNVPNALFWCQSALIASLLRKGGHLVICRLPNRGNIFFTKTFHISEA